MTWYGADPGGEKRFGMAALEADGSFETQLYSSVQEAFEYVQRPAGIGIDCPLWWSSGKGGGRHVDDWLRERYDIPPGTVQTANSLRGAATVQGLLLAMRLRKMWRNIPITESHPGAHSYQMGRPAWSTISRRFKLKGREPDTADGRDALLGAIAAREGQLKRWKTDLSVYRNEDEENPKNLWFGPVCYWWPDPYVSIDE